MKTGARRETRPITHAEITRKIDAFHSAKTAKQQLAILDFLDAVPRGMRKYFKRPGWVMDPVFHRANVNYRLGCSLFVKAERAYWKHHDPGDIPNQCVMLEEFEPTNRAIERARKTNAPTKQRKRAIDYTEARTQLEPYAARGGSGIGNETEAGMMLGTIALREARYLDAIRCLDRVPDSRKRGLLASAHLALGDRDSAKRALLEKVRGDVPSDRGFIAELDGKRDTAIAAYVEALAAPVAIWRTYAAFRLKRMKVAPKTIKHIKAAQDAARNEGKIVVSDAADFYAKFSEIAEAIRKHEKISAPRKPMADAAIDKLRLPTRRRGKAPLVSVPRSMATILRYDRDFRLFDGAPPLLSTCEPVDIEKLVRKDLRLKLPASKSVWNDDPTLPACIALSNPGDQRVFLYMGTPDEDGEYPVARYDDQPEIWISAASLVDHILEAAGAILHCTVNFGARLERARKRNQQHREALSEHVDVEAMLD